jgi:hypothetical protein
MSETLKSLRVTKIVFTSVIITVLVHIKTRLYWSWVVFILDEITRQLNSICRHDIASYIEQ